MKPRAARAALLCAVLLVVAGTALCTDGKQRSSAFVIDDDSDDESEDAGAPRRVVQSDTTNVGAAPAQLLQAPAQPLQQACPCTPLAGVPRVYRCCVSGWVLANPVCVATGGFAMARVYRWCDTSHDEWCRHGRSTI